MSEPDRLTARLHIIDCVSRVTDSAGELAAICQMLDAWAHGEIEIELTDADDSDDLDISAQDRSLQ